jgi:uncharacterized protein YjbI with pentapeptide repeats
MGRVKIYYIKKSLLITVFSVPIVLCIKLCLSDASSVKVEKNIERLRNTNSCPGCELFYANLRGANLSSANLISANLFHADLSGANLTNANLTNAYLSGANFGGANLTHAKLNNAEVIDTYFFGVKGLTLKQKKDLKKHGAIIETGETEDNNH